MNFQPSKLQITHSWKICKQSNLPPKMHNPALIIPEEVVKQRIQQNQILTTTYSRYITEINAYLEGHYVFTLVDPDGFMLLIDFNAKMPGKVTQYPVFSGVSLIEQSCGTNAVALSMKYNDMIFLRPEQHYCYFMKDWAGCAVPLDISGKVVGYLCMAALNQSLSKESRILVKLLAEKLVKAIEIEGLQSQSHISIQFSDVQKDIIMLMSNGLTEKAIALQLNLNVNTIKYHKKVIFQKLEAQCSTEAIAKAINYGIIPLKNPQ